MEHKLKINDTINIAKNKKVAVSELVKNKGEIFNLIKRGYQFDDEVLEAAHIKKTVSGEKITNVVVNHIVEKEKKYAKDTESLKTILKSLNTIDNQEGETFDSENIQPQTNDGDVALLEDEEDITIEI